MRIEEELKTNKFQNEIQKAHVNIIFTAYHLRNRIHKRIKPHGLTLEQFNVLRIVRGQMPNGIRIKDITSRMIEPSSNTTRLIDRLESRGLVNRVHNNDGDRRERPVFMTDAGEELLVKIEKEWKKNSPHSSKITAAQAKEFNTLLDILREE